MRYGKRKWTLILLLTILGSCRGHREIYPSYFLDETGCYSRDLKVTEDYIGFVSEMVEVDPSFCLNNLGHKFNDYIDLLEMLEEQRLRCSETN